MAIQIVGLGEAMVTQTSRTDDCPATIPLLSSSATDWELLTLESDARQRYTTDASNTSAFLVLDGFGTFHIDTHRRSLGPGHLLVAEESGPIEIHNDHETIFRALVMATTTQKTEPSEDSQ